MINWWCVPPGLQGAPSCWVVLTQDRQTKVLLANGVDLYILDNTSCTPVVRQTHATYSLLCLIILALSPLTVCVCVFQTPPGLSPQACSIVNMAVSFSYKYLALFTDSGHLWMGSANLKVTWITIPHTVWLHDLASYYPCIIYCLYTPVVLNPSRHSQSYHSLSRLPGSRRV